ncbi:MAG: FAD-dependent oxidoreductase [Bacteroidales bacterium]|nr:FAD-dependent oxidoreductase [Bacteroidales bacterium]
MRKLMMMLTSVMIVMSCNEVEETDVLVIGGGASGVCAGLQAARMGVNTVILEETPWLGGMLTSAGVSCVDGNYKLRSGIFGEFTDSLAARYGGYPSLQTGWVSNINFDPHVGQEIFTSMTEAESAYLTVERNAEWKSVRTVNDRKEVIFVDEDGRKRLISAKVLIDATELGDVAKACGVAYRIGMDSSSETGESIAPENANDVIQDMTFVAFLKDYGPDADMTIDKPEGYDPSLFADSCLNPLSDGVAETGQTVWSPEMMITYGRTPGGRYMINWPIYGNDWYANVIDASPEERRAAYDDARNFTLCFVYFIQTQLGMKNLGLADDVFPTEDRLPFFPYHRESRRIRGEAFFTMDAAAAPYGYEKPYYRTGIAVGDYAVDHHHFRHPQWRSLPDLHFYPIPSFNVPMGVLLPEDSDGLIVAEKSVSVSNLINGATRLQPVVMQLGQAAGVIAALAAEKDVPVKAVSVRDVQSVLLDAGGYIMPYLDLPKSHPHFKAVQRIGATGILRGEGRNVGWENQTWFRTADPLLAEEIHAEGYYGGHTGLGNGPVSVGNLIQAVSALGGNVMPSAADWWSSLGLTDFNADRTATRLEAAVVIDAAFNPFNMYEVDYDGEFLR